MNILFTCGGTAGHVNPAVALANVFQQKHPGCRILFVGAENGIENTLVPKEGYDLRCVSITNFRRSFAPADILHNLGTLMLMSVSKRQAKVILKWFKPDLVVGTGGYASFPIVNAAAKQGIPTAVHESNAVPGLTTKSLSREVDRVMVGFEESRAHYPEPEKVVVTGTPVRSDFFRYTREEARAKLGITDERPLLLSYWGSLGAEGMNRKMIDFIAKECYEGTPYHHIHGAGRDYSWMQEELQKRGLKLEGTGVEVREYIYDMPLVMAAADVVLCRAGASTVSEVTAIAKPSILVPSPYVTANHQEKNARVLSDQGAAVLLREADCVNDTLYDSASLLLRGPARREEMIGKLQAMSITNATEKIYDCLMEVATKKKKRKLW